MEDKEFEGLLKEIAFYKYRYEHCKEELMALRAAVNKDVWYWQGDGYDFPESLTCNVVMSASSLRDLLKKEKE